ncbi:CDK5 regulatory subunit-associated protein 3 [Amphibalanus amphitrite]|uniref:CDK5 regulatory subunit-associated protein 3 n=1 Tax=Amphibalanus amphitrite TaxID=1232801 RepID=A0A6A4UYZ3_AMPAM|nr:CDK5 regulatory subunit-associated protein 3 [Amphibalanus amphitrite]
MQDLPIDIHTNKLLDWLVSRRHCEKNWQEAVLAIREKISHAIQDMPEHPEIVRLLSGSHINYYHCLKIVDILKETEKDSKNLFGFYGSQRMKDWQEVVKLYANKNVGLAEASQALVRNVNYEIPGIKKQIAKLEQMQTDCDKRAQDYQRNSKMMREQYEASCRQLGLQGVRLKTEIVHLLDELPQVYGEIVEKARTLRETMAYHVAFVTFVNPSVAVDQLLPTLHFLVEHGDVTTYQWRYGEPPLRVEPPPPAVDLSDDQPTDAGQGDEIDFGDGAGIDFGDSGEIDFGDEVAADAVGDIDWGGIEVADVAAPEGDAPVDLSAAGVADITIEGSGMEGGVARDSEALTLLDNPHTRTLIVNDLMELETFLAQRVAEMSDSREDGMVSMSTMQAAPQSVQLQTVDSVSAFRAATRAVLDSLNTVKLQHLFLVKSSPRYVDRLVGSLKQKLEVSEKMAASVDAVKERKKAAAEEAAQLQPKLKLIVEKTRELQTQIENSISEKYKGRSVNLMGGINAI